MAEDVQKYLCDLETEFTLGILISPVIFCTAQKGKKDKTTSAIFREQKEIPNSRALHKNICHGLVVKISGD